MTTQATIESGAFLKSYEQQDSAAPFHPLRCEGFECFSRLGFPTLKDEEWRYTSIKPIVRGAFTLDRSGAANVPGDVLEKHGLHETSAHQVVFVNGRFAPELSSIGTLDDGVKLDSLASIAERDFASIESHLTRYTDLTRETFTALNTAFLDDGVFLHIPRDVRLEEPVHVVFLTMPDTGPIMTHPRVLVVAEPGSEATIIETYATGADEAYFTNTVTELVVGENATLDHYKIERESEQAFHVSSLNVHQSANSNVVSHNFSFGGRLVRNHVNVALAGEGCDSTFNGLTLGHGTQHVDNYLRIDHLKPHCNSWEYYKTILDDKSRGVFTGRIYVAPDAQKTDAKQTSMNLLLTDEADVTTKPQLEIFADDVKCTHGATIGQIEESQLFYLQTRGIDPVAARNMLIYAFANETISEVKVEEIRNKLEHLLLERLPQGQLVRGGS